MHVSYNPNPQANRVGDCVVRAISKLTNQEWEKTYIDLCIEGLCMCDMPSANNVWGSYLKHKGYKRKVIPEEKCDCYSVADFCRDHPHGKYMLALNGHVVACENGNYFDLWDSGQEVAIYFWYKEE